MTMTTAILLSCAMLGQTGFSPAPTPVPAQSGMGTPPAMAQQAFNFRLLALQAMRNENATEQSIDPQIEWYKEVLTQLPFESYEQVTAGEAEVTIGQATRMPIDANYDVYLLPTGVSPNGSQEVPLNVRITHATDGSPVDAIRANCIATANQVLIFQGLDYDQGELLVILGLQSDDQEQQSGSQEQQEQNQDQDDQEQDQENNQGEDNQDQQNQQDQQDQDDDQQPQASEQKGREEIEALLDMLEAMDKQLQSDTDDERSVREIGGAWW